MPAAVNVGVRPTFETGRGVLIESYLIDHDARPLRTARCGSRSSPGCAARSASPSVEELVAQMHRDVEQARELCAAFKPPR